MLNSFVNRNSFVNCNSFNYYYCYSISVDSLVWPPRIIPQTLFSVFWFKEARKPPGHVKAESNWGFFLY